MSVGNLAGMGGGGGPTRRRRARSAATIPTPERARDLLELHAFVQEQSGVAAIEDELVRDGAVRQIENAGSLSPSGRSRLTRLRVEMRAVVIDIAHFP